MLIVAACFGLAIYMINNSYNEWQTSPVSTTITTHPISYLEFPTVTVCPPRGTNTALNIVLAKVKKENFTNEERQKLKSIAREVFIELPNRKYANQMIEQLSIKHMRSILDDDLRFPQIDEDGHVTLKFQEGQGSFKTPGFGDLNFQGDFYDRNRSFNLVLEVWSDSQRLNDIVISVETEGSWSYRFSASGYQVYDHLLSMPEAKKFCVSQGGHLPSVTSEAENDEIGKIAKRGFVWLGARRRGQSGSWSWLDETAWDYDDWARYTLSPPEPSNRIGEDCVRFCNGLVTCGTGARSGAWYDDPCDLAMRPVCLIPPNAPSKKLSTLASGNDTLLMKRYSVSTRSSFQLVQLVEP